MVPIWVLWVLPCRCIRALALVEAIFAASLFRDAWTHRATWRGLVKARPAFCGETTFDALISNGGKLLPLWLWYPFGYARTEEVNGPFNRRDLTRSPEMLSSSLSFLSETPRWYYVAVLPVLPITVLVLARSWRRYQAQQRCLRHRHFVITGGSSGIGRALALEVARRGANVTLIARNADRLEEVKLEVLEAASSPEQAVHTLSVDLTDCGHGVNDGNGGEAHLVQGVAEAEQVCGPVDYLVNCAGSALSQHFDETPLSDFRRMMEARDAFVWLRPINNAL
ncbi:hypothetical protein HPB48_011977 [Haemaphysalis longicornis]|uniref:Uncharacterized protein n=1 Tax=Haemaphysalis longicornis TaxID=44386 RepID=A0A9J6H253_HAELO|nr:hypothetical protein HPB48_011977 [Haemaphysalis longicornis]